MARLSLLLPCLFAALYTAAPLSAQEAPKRPLGEPPTPGVYNPTLGLAGLGDASSVEKNPAQLGLLSSWSGVYLHSELDPHGLVGGRGDGFFVATPLPLLSTVAVGAGLQLLRPPVRFPYRDEQKLSLALGWRLWPGIALGLSYAHLFAATGPVAQGLDTLDLALSLLPLRWLAAALVVHDVPSPTLHGLPLQRVWEPELALRPWQSDRLEIGLGARFGERRGDIDPHFRIWVIPFSGVSLKADLEWRRDVDLDGVAENDLRFGVGLAIDLSHFGLEGFGLFGTDSGRLRGHGFTLAARLSGDRYPAVWRGPRHLVRLELAHLDERKLAALLAYLHRLRRAPEVEGVVCVVGDLEASWATAEELRGALSQLRAAHKHVYAYLGETTTRGYYVAAAAERIYQDPAGGIRLTGLASTLLFFGGLAERLGVQADFVKIGEYKSAPEQYTRTDSTPPARAQREQLITEVYAHLLSGIAKDRRVSTERAGDWVDRGPYTAAEAKAAGLVDELTYGDEVADAIGERLGHRVAVKERPRAPERDVDWQRPQVAVLFVDGDIVDGKSAYIPLLDMRLAGLETLLPAIERARSDARVKALVVRIDSPGGSALASDQLARAIAQTAKVKPVICSLGDVAASGGYFIAAACQKIYTAPSTLTGSIGIFTGKFDLSGLVHKVGITFERYERGAHAGLDSKWRPYTAEERALILQKLRYFYGRFIDRVARGRHLTPAQVDAVGRGHIWSGEAALARGLIDAYGGLMDAVTEAKRRAGLDAAAPVTLAALPDQPSLLRQLLGLIGLGQTQASESMLSRLLGPALRGLPGSLMAEPSVPQARLDFTVVE